MKTSALHRMILSSHPRRRRHGHLFNSTCHIPLLYPTSVSMVKPNHTYLRTIRPDLISSEKHRNECVREQILRVRVAKHVQPPPPVLNKVLLPSAETCSFSRDRVLTFVAPVEPMIVEEPPKEEKKGGCCVVM